jgi:hypothetical protein
MPGIRKIKTPAAAGEKFATRAGGAQNDYKMGVQNAGQAWQDSTVAAEPVYAQATQDAIGRGAFGKGVTKAGGAKFQDRASSLGANRYPSGIAAGKGAYVQNVQPYFDTLAGLQLPAKRVKGQNQERSNVVAQALHAKRISATT